METLRAMLAQVDDNDFLAELTVYSREQAFMKDTPCQSSLSTADSVQTLARASVLEGPCGRR